MVRDAKYDYENVAAISRLYEDVGSSIQQEATSDDGGDQAVNLLSTTKAADQHKQMTVMIE